MHKVVVLGSVIAIAFVLNSPFAFPVAKIKYRKINFNPTALSPSVFSKAPRFTGPTRPTTPNTLTNAELARIPVTLSSSLPLADNHVLIVNGTELPDRNQTFKLTRQSSNNFEINHQQKYVASYEDLESRFSDENLIQNNTSVNMTVPLGETAFLRCRVRNLGERSVSWIRWRDWHILTSMNTTYINDKRFHLLHADGTVDWTLQIKFVEKQDNGTYECHVSTGTGILSLVVNLFVTVPEAFILGSSELHVKEGGSITLVCVFVKSPKPPEFILWYHNQNLINYGEGSRIILRTESGIRTESKLAITPARIMDSGNYTCQAANAEPISIFVHVSSDSGHFSIDHSGVIQRHVSHFSSTVRILTTKNTALSLFTSVFTISFYQLITFPI